MKVFFHLKWTLWDLKASSLGPFAKSVRDIEFHTQCSWLGAVTTCSPLHLKKLQKLRNSVVLDVMCIGLSKIANRRAFLKEIKENLWSEKYANPRGHNTAHSKWNFKLIFSHFEWLDLRPTNFKECACLRTILCHDMVLHDSLKFLSFIEITVHPQICCFWGRWVDIANLYNCSLLNFFRTIQQMPSNSDWK